METQYLSRKYLAQNMCTYMGKIKSKRHSFDNVLGYNALINWLIFLRSGGKSFGYKAMCVYDFLERDRLFVYVRRYRDEYKKGKNSFFDDIGKKVFPEHKFSCKGDCFYIDGKLAGYGAYLSNVGYFKSVVYDEKTFNIIFDECIPEGNYNRYIPNEPAELESLVKSIIRDRDFRVCCIGNPQSTVTPYNVYFDLPCFNKTYFKKSTRHLIYVDTTVTKGSDRKVKTSFDTAFAGTKYQQYSSEGVTMADESSFVQPVPYKTCELCFIIRIEESWLGCYLDHKGGKIFFSDSTDKTFPLKLVFNFENMREYEKLCTSNMNYLKVLKNFKSLGRIYYANAKTKIISQQFLSTI